MKMKMNAKNLLVSFLAIASILLLATTVSAGEITDTYEVTVEGITVVTETAYVEDVSVIAGETITVKVYFTAAENDTDVTMEAEIEGNKVDVDAVTSSFDVIEGKSYRKVLTLKVPYELKDELNDELTLNIELDGKEHKTDLDEITLEVQRPSYNVDFKSINVASTIEAGETFPVDIVLKNIGYNDLDDLYVTASIPGLELEQTAYFGDLVSDEWNDEYDDDETDTWSGRLLMEVPYNVEAGLYALELKVENDDTVITEVKQIVIGNEFETSVIVSADAKTVAVGADAEYSLLIVNPTNKLKVYRVVSESTDSVSSNAEQSVIAIPAGSSKTVQVTANAGSEGEYSFDINVFSGSELVDTVTLNLNAQGKSVTNPIVILTVILAIVFLVLLVVLIVLVTKKPQKSEEFGESYY
jgi:hypothetical protein